MNSTTTSSRIIKFSGFCNIGLGATLAFVPLHPLLGIDIPAVWAILLGALLFYTAATLIIGSTDLQRYASILIYEAMLRFIAALLLISAAVFSTDYGDIILLAGISDAFWGLVYCVVVPRATGRSLSALLKNQATVSVENDYSGALQAQG